MQREIKYNDDQHRLWVHISKFPRRILFTSGTALQQKFLQYTG